MCFKAKVTNMYLQLTSHNHSAWYTLRLIPYHKESFCVQSKESDIHSVSASTTCHKLQTTEATRASQTSNYQRHNSITNFKLPTPQIKYPDNKYSRRSAARSLRAFTWTSIARTFPRLLPSALLSIVTSSLPPSSSAAVLRHPVSACLSPP